MEQLELLKALMPIASVVVFLVGIGITYGMAKNKIAALEEDVNRLEKLYSDIAEIKGDIKVIKSHLKIGV